MVDRIERIKACLNGRRTRDEHPAVPVTPAQLAAAAAQSVAAGAEAVHLHARDGHGAESVRGEDVGAAVSAIRQATGGVPIGVSTGLWITDGDMEARHSAVLQWRTLPASARPDFASVNVSEPGSAALIHVLHGTGIEVEAGVWSAADAGAVAAGCLRILVEVIDAAAADAVSIADEILRALDEADASGPRLLHGEGAGCWPLVAHAGRLGLATRIGLEDTTVGPDGQSVTDNAELVRLGLAQWTAAAT